MTIPRQFLLFRDLFLWTKINWKHYWRSIQVPSDHRGRLSKQQQYLTRGKLKMYTFCCSGYYSQLYRAEGWQGRIVQIRAAISERVGWEWWGGDDWTHRVRGERKPMVTPWSVSVWGWMPGWVCGALSGDMPHLSKLSEPRQRRGDH